MLHKEGPLLVVAGAGSGKTRVITRRIAQLVRSGIPPYSILAMTFTNKAAQEMRERVHRLVQVGGALLSTFHSFGARILRMDGREIGVPENFTIYDGGEQQRLVKELLKEVNLDPVHYRPSVVLEKILRMKNEGIPPEGAKDITDHFSRSISSVYELYIKRLKESHALDFDDLLLETKTLFSERDDVLDRYRERFRFLLIDEYQDTNRVQYEIARMLAGNRMNICATGDPDQSIYSWRGARIRNILEFENDFAGTKVVRLEQNYRSTGNILKAASAVIRNNCFRKERELWTDAGDGDRITLCSAPSDAGEAEFVARTVAQLHMAGRSYDGMAVFYRINALSRALERAFALSNIPYVLIGSVAFYERQEVKDLMAYLKLINNQRDGVSFLRIVNTPARSIGLRTVEKVKKIAREQGCGLVDAVREICSHSLLPARQVNALSGFLELIDGLLAFPRFPVEEMLREIIDKAGYFGYLKALEKKEASSRLENVDELIAAVAEYDRLHTDGSLAGFLEEAALIQGIDDWDENSEKVVFMTLHTAKGLEFNTVFMVGLEDGVLPHQFSLNDGTEDALEEERRLFYVGITRARQKLYISKSAVRQRYGSVMASKGSRFLDELPSSLLESSLDFGLGSRTMTGASGIGAGATLDPSDGSAAGLTGSFLEYDADEAPEFSRGDSVLHPYFGHGTVLQAMGSGNTAKVRVRFPKEGIKLLIVRYARLKKVL